MGIHFLAWDLKAETSPSPNDRGRRLSLSEASPRQECTQRERWHFPETELSLVERVYTCERVRMEVTLMRDPSHRRLVPVRALSRKRSLPYSSKALVQLTSMGMISQWSTTTCKPAINLAMEHFIVWGWSAKGPPRICENTSRPWMRLRTKYIEFFRSLRVRTFTTSYQNIHIFPSTRTDSPFGRSILWASPRSPKYPHPLWV